MTWITLTDLPPELIQEILEYGLHNDADALLGLASTCKYLCHTLWPLYAAARWERFWGVLNNSHLIKLSTDSDPDSDSDDDDDESPDEYETDTSDDSEGSYGYTPKTYRIVHRVKTGPAQTPGANPYRPESDPFTTAYTRVVIRLANAYGNPTTQALLVSFVRRAHSIAALTLDFGSGANIHFGSALVRAGGQLPGVELTIRGLCLTGHEDWHSGPYNPIPAVPTGEVRNKEDYAHALRRPRTVDVAPLTPSTPARMSTLTIFTDQMFVASMYPLTLSLLAFGPAATAHAHQGLTSVTLHALSLDAFNWSQILPSITLPFLADLTLTRLELSGADLVPFLTRHERTLTSLDLTHTLAHAMTLRLLSSLSFPVLSSLRADPACLVPLLQSYIHTHTSGGGQSMTLGALNTIGISFPARLALALRTMPQPHAIPPELDDLAVRDLSDFHAVYGLLSARFCAGSSPGQGQGQSAGLTTLEMENLRYNGFVEWVLSQPHSPSPPSLASVHEIDITDGDLLVRRGTVLPLAQWMGRHCPAWRAAQAQAGVARSGVSRFSQPTDAGVQEMVRMFFSAVCPGMVSLQYKMVS